MPNILGMRVDPAQDQLWETALTGRSLLECPILNKGSAFTEEERRELGLLGLLPPHVSTLEEQVARRYYEYQRKTSDLERYIFLRALQDRNETLYYRLLEEHISEMLPAVYTPIVGAACQHYSTIYRRPRGLFVSYPHREDMDLILANRPYREVDVIVVTDGERILGLGDQGVGGMGIPVGKLSLYTLCAGIHPARTLPIMLDVGTDNPQLLEDPLYLGWRHTRIRGPEYDAFIDTFVQAVKHHLPGVLLQWEDFGVGNAFRLLERYRDQLCTFNDDIQGTGAVVTAALLAAVRRTGSRLRDQRIVILGAGSAGVGVADQIIQALLADRLSEADAHSRLWLVDRHGLLQAGMEGLLPFQERHRQSVERLVGWQRDSAQEFSLREVLNRVHPTVLIGVSARNGAFPQDLVQLMAEHVARPIIFALSNPISCSEAQPADLIRWTNGRAIIATGSPFAAVAFGGRTIPTAQCNNAYVFPGIGLGAIATRAQRITDSMLQAAARELSECSAADASDADLLPALEQIQEVSRRIAVAVGEEAQRQGVAPAASGVAAELIDNRRWRPSYVTLHRAKSTRPQLWHSKNTGWFQT
jgi:malate dehydrogenase (oxaloacetate-decarboxylating)